MPRRTQPERAPVGVEKELAGLEREEIAREAMENRSGTGLRPIPCCILHGREEEPYEKGLFYPTWVDRKNWTPI